MTGIKAIIWGLILTFGSILLMYWLGPLTQVAQ